MKRLLRQIRRNQSGITLVELLIGSLISLVIAGSILEFYISQHNQWLAQEQISDMQQNSRAVIEELTKQIRSAGYGITGQSAYQVKGDTLILYTKPGADVDTIRYYIDKSDTLHPNLIKRVDTGAPQVFAENISQISFAQPDSSLLQVTLTTRQDRPDEDYVFNSGYRTRELTTRIKLRNRS